jgi:hypothetical protein
MIFAGIGTTIGKLRRARRIAGLALFSGLALAGPCRFAVADMSLSQVIVDLGPDQPPRDDIEVANTGPERLYVVVEPAEIMSPGQPGEHREQRHDPEQLGLLATPNRLVLEPGQRKLVRIAALAPRGERDRIYRVVIKPVVGELAAQQSALRILVGYDVLVIVRPKKPVDGVTGSRSGRTLTIHNAGNTNAEIFEGRQCDEAGKNCAELPAKRLYAGASWEQILPRDAPVSYTVRIQGQATVRRF